MNAIEVEALEKTYPKGIRALDGVSFAVCEGEVFGLLGPNGAGKSTTVKILATLTTADAGRAVVAGRDVRVDANAVRQVIGYVPQQSGVDREATGRENLTLQGRIQGRRGPALRRRVEELLERLDLTAAADRLVKTYSGGMKRRLDIGLGLVHDPAVVYLDEPTTGLDPEARVAMWAELERLVQEERLTVLLTTHYLEEAERLTDRLAIVSRGAVVVEGTPDALKSSLRGDAVTVELGERSAEAAAGIVAALAGVEEAQAHERVLRARVADGRKAVPEILSALEAGGIAVATVTVARPSLDDVYMRFTGRDFRAEDEAST
ncbi:MAG: ABC transporter ATP-binding protein [Actinomycetia bacterium]|nr:ABC transporter ATP-binding protein [Actinomycetes bacterium]